MYRTTKWLVAAAFALTLWTGTAHAGVSDPLAAVKSLYGSHRTGAKPNTGTSTIDTLYNWADRNLKRKLLANGVCTLPLRKREIVCTLTFDPTVAGVAVQLPDPTVTVVAATPGERQIDVAFLDDEIKIDLVYRFVRSGASWELADVDANPPHRPAWKLSEIIGGN